MLICIRDSHEWNLEFHQGFQYEAHQMGTNCIDCQWSYANTDLSSDLINITVITGGDDQALTYAKLRCNEV